MATVAVTIVNRTGNTLSYFVNTSLTQPVPASITDFTKVNANATIPIGATVNITASNSTGTSCGIYFFNPGSALTSFATGVSLVNLLNGNISNVSGSMFVNSSGNVITVTLNSPSNGSGGWWIFVIIAIIVIFLVLLIAWAFTKEKTPETVMMTTNLPPPGTTWIQTSQV